MKQWTLKKLKQTPKVLHFLRWDLSPAQVAALQAKPQVRTMEDISRFQQALEASQGYYFCLIKPGETPQLLLKKQGRMIAESFALILDVPPRFVQAAWEDAEQAEDLLEGEAPLNPELRRWLRQRLGEGWKPSEEMP